MGFNCAVDSLSPGSHLPAVLKQKTYKMVYGATLQLYVSVQQSAVDSYGWSYLSSESGLFGKWLTSGIVSVAFVEKSSL